MLASTLLSFIALSLLQRVHAGPSPVTPLRPSRRQTTPPPSTTTWTGNDITSDLIPNAVNTVCGGNPGVPKVISLNFDTGIKFTAGDCPPAPEPSTTMNAKIRALLPPNEQEERVKRELVARGGCNYPPNFCSNFAGGAELQGYARCGQECDSDCYWGDGGPDPNDCQKIFNDFSNRQDQVFTIGHDKFLLFTYASCGTGIQNQIANDSADCASNMIYDYTDWASVGQYLAWNCQGSQGARGGKCLSSNSADFYLQVYKN